MRGVDDLERVVSEDVASDPLPVSTAHLFAPVDKRAFGAAIGVALAMTIAGVTLLDLVARDRWEGLALLAQYFPGYTVSLTGAVAGAAWGMAVGFVAGWLLAFVRNLTLALSLFMIRGKAELEEASDFLDHI
jgi:hypothetical protein